jgi:hypothetical protein
MTPTRIGPKLPELDRRAIKPLTLKPKPIFPELDHRAIAKRRHSLGIFCPRMKVDV